MRVSIALLVLTGSLAVSRSADAVIIDFEGVANTPSDPITVDGFTFDYVPDIGGIVEDGFIGGGVNNGTDKLITMRPTATTLTTLKEFAGSDFTLINFDAANFFSATVGGRTINVTGQLSGGGTVATSFTTSPDAFSTFNLPTIFTGLSQVSFESSGPGTAAGEGLQLDNVNVDVNVSVLSTPAPSSLAALASLAVAAGAFTAIRRRKKAL